MADMAGNVVNRRVPVRVERSDDRSAADVRAESGRVETAMPAAVAMTFVIIWRVTSRPSVVVKTRSSLAPAYSWGPVHL